MSLDLNWNGLAKVISGGQTGVDQGALLAAWRMGLETGGQAPKAFKVQGGYNPLLEILGLTAEGDYAERTLANIKNSDATIIVANDFKSPGTVLTKGLLQKVERPSLEIDISDIVSIALKNRNPDESQKINQLIIDKAQLASDFIIHHKVQILNVAGNRELKPIDNRTDSILLLTSITDWILHTAFNLLELEDKIIFKNTSQKD